jgi:hypothetical protein
MSITPAFTRAVHFRFAVPHEANRTEYDSARVANLASEESVIREKLVALLDGQQHPYPPSPSSSSIGPTFVRAVQLPALQVAIEAL